MKCYCIVGKYPQERDFVFVEQIENTRLGIIASGNNLPLFRPTCNGKNVQDWDCDAPACVAIHGTGT